MFSFTSKVNTMHPSLLPTRVLLLVSACLLMVGQVAAQTYSFRELKPASALCELASFAPLDQDGNVHGECTMWTGGIYFESGYPAPDMRTKAVTWKADGSRTISSYPFGASVFQTWGRGPEGRTYADLVATPVRRYNDLKRLGTYTYNGSTWAKWVAPAPLTGAWTIADNNPLGMLLLASQNATEAGVLAVVKDKAVTKLPAVPATAQGYTVGSTRVSTTGHVLVKMMMAAEGVAPRWYLWNGVQWQERTMAGLASQILPGLARGPGMLDFNSADVALVVTDDTPHDLFDKSGYRYQLWNTVSDTLQELPTRLIYQPQGGLNDSGVVAGENLPVDAKPADYFGPRRATIWRAGQVIDLNDVSTLPAGVVLRRAIAINNKGHVLVGIESIDGSSRPWSWGVLTPQ